MKCYADTIPISYLHLTGKCGSRFQSLIVSELRLQFEGISSASRLLLASDKLGLCFSGGCLSTLSANVLLAFGLSDKQ